MDRKVLDDVNRPEVGHLRVRLFIEHGRLAESCRQLEPRPASHGDGWQRDSCPGPV